MDWRDQAVAAVVAWLDAEGDRGSRRDRQRIGVARRDAEPGWYLVDLRGRRLSPDQLDDLELSAGQREVGHRVLETVLEGEVLRVRVGAHVVADDLALFATRHPSSFLIEALRDHLQTLADPGLADALARGRLSAIPPLAPSAEVPAGWHEGQRQAFAACCAPGLYLVWGPPGTGKTTVLAKAIVHLLGAGKRVLLTSATNIAVDNAL